MMYFENFAPGTKFEAGRTPRARGRRGARGSSRELLGGSRKLCGASRDVSEGCRRFWKRFYWDSKRLCDDFVMIVLPELAGDQF